MLLTHNAYPYNGTRKVVIENDYMKDSLSGCVKNDLNLDLQLMPLVYYGEVFTSCRNKVRFCQT